MTSESKNSHPTNEFRNIFLREGRRFKLTYESVMLPSEIGNEIISFGFRNVTILRLGNEGSHLINKKFKSMYLIYNELNDNDDDDNEEEEKQSFFFVGDNRHSDSFADDDDMTFDDFHLTFIAENKSRNITQLDINYEEFIYESVCIKLSIPIVPSIEDFGKIERSIIRGISELKEIANRTEFMKYLTYQEISSINKEVITNEIESDEDGSEESENDSQNN